MASKFNLDWSLRHDILNYIFLPIIIMLDIWYLIEKTEFSKFMFSRCFAMYLGIDILWIFLKPESVSSPTIILLHHMFTFVGAILIPYLREDVVFMVAAGSLVEVNTFARIVRKKFRDSVLMDIFFYGSWIVIRCITWPWFLYSLTMKVFFTDPSLTDFDKYLNIAFLIIGVTLNIMNLKWTYELLFVGSTRSRESKGL
eukprot:gene5047-7044_t